MTDAEIVKLFYALPKRVARDALWRVTEQGYEDLRKLAGLEGSRRVSLTRSYSVFFWPGTR